MPCSAASSRPQPFVAWPGSDRLSQAESLRHAECSTVNTNPKLPPSCKIKTMR